MLFALNANNSPLDALLRARALSPITSQRSRVAHCRRECRVDAAGGGQCAAGSGQRADVHALSRTPERTLTTLRSSGTRLKSTHLAVATPPERRAREGDPAWRLPRGVVQRNAALQWIRCAARRALGGALSALGTCGSASLTRSAHNLQNKLWHVAARHRLLWRRERRRWRRGGARSARVFVQDDNVYDWRLFEEIRGVERAGVWPVGLVGGLIAETPLLADGRVRGFNAAWRRERPFPIDMAAFAVNIALLDDFPAARFSFDVPRGYQARGDGAPTPPSSPPRLQESHLLTSLGLNRSDLEPRAHACTRVLVWHTRTETPKLDAATRHRIANASELSALERDALIT